MDVLSYVLRLFTDIHWARYVAATALGVAPAAAVLVGVGKLPYAFEIMWFGVADVVVVAHSRSPPSSKKSDRCTEFAKVLHGFLKS
jgi:hypothetical protein